MASEIGTEAKKRAVQEQKKNGVNHEARGAYVKLSEAIYARFPADDHKDVTTVGDMIDAVLEIARKVLA